MKNMAKLECPKCGHPEDIHISYFDSKDEIDLSCFNCQARYTVKAKIIFEIEVFLKGKEDEKNERSVEKTI